jgi:hypothetical protein
MKKHMAIIKMGNIHHKEALKNSDPYINITSFFIRTDGEGDKKDTHFFGFS